MIVRKVTFEDIEKARGTQILHESLEFYSAQEQMYDVTKLLLLYIKTHPLSIQAGLY